MVKWHLLCFLLLQTTIASDFQNNATNSQNVTPMRRYNPSSLFQEPLLEQAQFGGEVTESPQNNKISDKNDMNIEMMNTVLKGAMTFSSWRKLNPSKFDKNTYEKKDDDDVEQMENQDKSFEEEENDITNWTQTTQLKDESKNVKTEPNWGELDLVIKRGTPAPWEKPDLFYKLLKANRTQEGLLMNMTVDSKSESNILLEEKAVDAAKMKKGENEKEIFDEEKIVDESEKEKLTPLVANELKNADEIKTVSGKQLNQRKFDEISNEETNNDDFDLSESQDKSFEFFQEEKNNEETNLNLIHAESFTKTFAKSSTKSRLSNEIQEPEEEITYDENFQLPRPWENPADEDSVYFGIKEILLAQTLTGTSGDITKYFQIICETMNEKFGKEEVKNQGALKVLRVARLFDQNFEKFIQDDSWGLKKNLIVPIKEIDYLQEECEKNIPHQEREQKFKILKRAVLRNLLDYYKDVATDGHQVDAIVEAFVPIIWTKFDLIHWKFENLCYLPHREDLVKTYCSFCRGWIKITNVTPNPAAVNLGLQAFFVQVGVPCLLFYYQNWRSQNTHGYIDWGEITNNLCPEPFADFYKRDSHENWYNMGTKLTGCILVSHLYHIMKLDVADQMKKFKINWQNPALPRKGMIVSRLINSMAFGLIILSTVTLFYQDANYGDLLLNVLGMQFIMDFDEELAKSRLVKQGIGSSNDGGRKLLLSYIANGIRNTNGVDALLNRTSRPVFSMMTLGIWVIYLWVFNCL